MIHSMSESCLRQRTLAGLAAACPYCCWVAAHEQSRSEGPDSQVVALVWPYAPVMQPDQPSRSLGRVLAAAEAASPVDAVAAVTRELGVALSATRDSFLIADLSGRALVRLAHVLVRTAEGADMRTPRVRGERRAEEESATVVPFDGGPAEQAVRTQEVQVVAPDPGRSDSDGVGLWLVLAPVTERGRSSVSLS